MGLAVGPVRHRKTFKRLPIDIEPLFGRDLDWCLVPDRSRFQYVSIYTRISSNVSRNDNKCLHGHHERINGSRKIHCKDPAITRFNGVSGYGSAIYWEMLVHTTLIVSCLMLKLHCPRSPWIRTRRHSRSRWRPWHRK